METTISDDFNAIMDALADKPAIDEAALISLSAEIKALSVKCQNTGLFDHSRERYEEFVAHIETNEPEDKWLINSWAWLMNRIVEAPFGILMHGAVVLCIPIVAKYLPNNEEQES